VEETVHIEQSIIRSETHSASVCQILSNSVDALFKPTHIYL